MSYRPTHLRHYPTPADEARSAAEARREFPDAVRRFEEARRAADDCRLHIFTLGLGRCHDPVPGGLPIPGATYAEVVAAVEAAPDYLL